eukprot:751960-Hanusia_phi.AAC.10
MLSATIPRYQHIFKEVSSLLFCLVPSYRVLLCPVLTFAPPSSAVSCMRPLLKSRKHYPLNILPPRKYPPLPLQKGKIPEWGGTDTFMWVGWLLPQTSWFDHLRAKGRRGRRRGGGGGGGGARNGKGGRRGDEEREREGKERRGGREGGGELERKRRGGGWRG